MRLLTNAFTAGLLDETLAGRVDLPQLSRGALRLDNFMPRIIGGLTRRPGTFYQGPLRGECRLMPFNFSAAQRFQLEAGDGYLRVWKDDERMSAEYAAPWTAADIHRWHFIQVNDVCFLTDREHEPQILTRRADNDWLLENWNDRIIAEPNGWPAMRAENDTTTTLTVSAGSGTGVFLTATGDVFTAEDVGSFYELAHRLDVPTSELSLSEGSGTASAVLTLTDIPTAGEQFSVGSDADLRVYTWVADAAAPGAYQIRIGSSGAEGAAANAVKALNGTVDAAVGPGTIAHPRVTARSGGTFVSGGVKATGRLAFSSGVLTNRYPEQFVIGSITYRFENSVASGAAYGIKMGASLADSIANAIKAINGTGTDGVHYTAGTIAHTEVVASASVVANSIDVSALAGGSAGNGIATTENSASFSWGGGYLTGGEDGSSAKVIVESRVPGADGNGIATADTMANASWNAATTSGGITIETASDALRVNGSCRVFTHGEWWGTLLLEAETSPGIWETFRSWTSRNDANFSDTITVTGERKMRLRYTGSGLDARAELSMSDSLIRGLVRIVSVTDARNAVCDVIREVYSTAATARWSEAAWSNRRGWPRTLALFEQALVFAGVDSAPQTIQSSAKGDFFNFKRDGLADSAWEYQLASVESSPVVWLAGSAYGLLAGTEKEEWLLSGVNGGAIVPTEVPNFARYTGHGSAGVQVGMAGGAMLFVQAGGRSLLEYIYDNERRGFVAPDMTELVEMAMAPGIRQLAWQRAPFNAVWAVLNDGTLMSLTYRREREVVAWAKHPMDGAFVESVCVTNGNDGLDEVTLAVRRTIGGTTIRLKERLDSQTFLALLRNDRSALNYMDCAKRVTLGAPSLTFPGFAHLEGALVAVEADGARRVDARVQSGTITLQEPATTVLAGFTYESAITPMPIEAQMQDGTAQGRRFKLAKMSVRYWRTAAADYATPDRDSWPETFREATSEANAAPPLFSGVKRVDLAAGYADSVEFTISTADTQPLNIMWVAPVFSVHGE